MTKNLSRSEFVCPLSCCFIIQVMNANDLHMRGIPFVFSQLFSCQTFVVFFKGTSLYLVHSSRTGNVKYFFLLQTTYIPSERDSFVVRKIGSRLRFFSRLNKTHSSLKGVPLAGVSFHSSLAGHVSQCFLRNSKILFP